MGHCIYACKTLYASTCLRKLLPYLLKTILADALVKRPTRNIPLEHPLKTLLWNNFVDTSVKTFVWRFCKCGTLSSKFLRNSFVGLYLKTVLWDSCETFVWALVGQVWNTLLLDTLLDTSVGTFIRQSWQTSLPNSWLFDRWVSHVLACVFKTTSLVLVQVFCLLAARGSRVQNVYHSKGSV